LNNFEHGIKLPACKRDAVFAKHRETPDAFEEQAAIMKL